MLIQTEKRMRQREHINIYFPAQVIGPRIVGSEANGQKLRQFNRNDDETILLRSFISKETILSYDTAERPAQKAATDKV